MLKKLKQKLVLYFIPKRIIYTTHKPPGILVKAYQIMGCKYLTIAVTNKGITNGQNAAILYHVPAHKAWGIKKATTPFVRWWYTKVLQQPIPKQPIKILAN